MITSHPTALQRRCTRRAAAVGLAALVLGLGVGPAVAQGAEPVTATTAADPRVWLSSEQQAYLQAHGPATLCVDPDWEPYEQVTPEGDYVGIGADLVRLVASRSGVPLELVRTADWDATVAASKEGRCDLLSFVNQTPARDEWLVFTDPIFVDPNVFITRVEHDYIADPAGLEGEVVALPEGTSIEERLRRDYPNLTVVTTESEREALRMVEQGQADMTLRSLTMAAYVIRKEGLFNLKIAGEIPEYANRLRIGVLNREPVLRDILNQGVRTLTPQEVLSIRNDHVAIEVTTPTDYGPVLRILAGAAVVVALGLLWILQLRRAHRRQKALSAELAGELAAREQAEADLRDSEERYRLLIDTSQDGVVVLQDGRFVFTNPAFRTLMGMDDEQLRSGPFLEFVHPDDRDLVRSTHQKRLAGVPVPLRYQFRVLAAGDRTVWVQVSGELFTWNDRPATLNFISDVTEQVEAQRQIEHMARHDPLTDLPNRALFDDRLERAITRVEREGGQLALLFVDLDRFKPVNDTYGHAVGDHLLQQVAARMLDVVRASDTVARIGGDEFVVLLPAVDAPAGARLVAAKLGESVSHPFEVDGHEISIGASIGIALFPVDGTTEQQLFAHADQAMYAAKHGGGGHGDGQTPDPQHNGTPASG